jgi:hypothetical protein
MATKLWAIGNATNSDASFTNTEHSGDSADCPKNSVIHSGGSDDNFVRIPDCSDSRYFADHHMSVGAKDGSWTVSFWDDDDNNHIFQWSPDAAYSGGHTVPNSDNWDSVAILIELGSNNVPAVSVTQWT